MVGKILLLSLPLAAAQKSVSQAAMVAAAFASEGFGSVLLAIGLLAFEGATSDLWIPSPRSKPSSAGAVTRRPGWIARASFIVSSILNFATAREASTSGTSVSVGMVGSWMLSAIFLALGCFAYETFVRKLTRVTASLAFPRAAGLRRYSVINVLGVSLLSGAVFSGAGFQSTLIGALSYFLVGIVIPIVGIIVSAFLVRDGLRFGSIGRVEGVADVNSFLSASARSRPPGSNATSWSCYLVERPEVVHRRVQARLVSSGFRITANVAPHGLAAEVRPVNLMILIVLVVLFWPGAILYYLIRKRNAATVGIKDIGTGSYVVVDAEGGKASDVLRLAIASLTLAPAPPGAASAPPAPD